MGRPANRWSSRRAYAKQFADGEVRGNGWQQSLGHFALAGHDRVDRERDRAANGSANAVLPPLICRTRPNRRFCATYAVWTVGSRRSEEVEELSDGEVHLDGATYLDHMGATIDLY